jgi:DNA polymerase I
MQLYLIDGYGFVFRAYHSLPPLSSPAGAPIGAVYGFVNMILKLLSNHTADMLAVVLDSGGKNYRHSLYPEYKAHRATPPDELITQFPIIREALAALNINVLEEPNTEADDIIASYAFQAAKIGHKVTVISSDKDLMQLLSYTNINIKDPLKNKDITDATILDKFGVTPIQLTDALALIGDSSDNIPGVPGIGPKTAADLLKTFGSIEDIYKNIEHVKSERIKNILLHHKETLFLSKRLVELQTNLEMKTPLDLLTIKNPDISNIIAFAEKYGFKTLLAKFKISHLSQTHTINQELYKLQSIHELSGIVKKLIHDGIFAIHISIEEVFIASSTQNTTIKYQNTTQANLFAPQNSGLALSSIINTLLPALTDHGVKKICFQAKNLMHILQAPAFEIIPVDDIALMSYVISTKNQYRDIDEILQNNTTDGASILMMYDQLSAEIQNCKLSVLYETIEKPLINVLYAVEKKGIMIDRALLQSLSIEFTNKANNLQNKIYAIAGTSLNLGSPKQLGDTLFNILAIPGGKKSAKTNAYTVDSETLESIASQGYEIASLVLEWRHLTKLVNTYTEPLQRLINVNTGRLHTTFEMTNTMTGRLSSHNPNLQNIPVRTPEGQKIRKAFIATPGNLVISADYSQIELRLLAHVADIDELKKVFIEDQDIHAVTASEIFNVPLADVSDDLRRKAKGINFGIIYGISPFGLARNIGISPADAKRYIDLYFKKYPGIKEYMAKYIDLAKQNGYVETIFRRRCAIEGINSSNYLTRSFAERAAINAPLQGSASDIIKKAMVVMPRYLSQYMVLQIHDELLFEIPINIAEEAAKEIVSVMENICELKVPMKVNASIGSCW